MTTVGEFRQAVVDASMYIIETEERDFIEQIERFEADDTCPASHVYLAAWKAICAVEEAEGVTPLSLGYTLHGPDHADYFICTNEQCGYIGTRYDPIQDRLILELDWNEPVPAGVCPHCAGTVHAI